MNLCYSRPNLFSLLICSLVGFAFVEVSCDFQLVNKFEIVSIGDTVFPFSWNSPNMETMFEDLRPPHFLSSVHIPGSIRFDALCVFCY